MRVKLQLVLCHDEGDEETVTDVITLNKNTQRIEHLGLTLSEAKQLLSTTQRHLLRQQVDAFLNTYADCPDCGTPLHLKARSRRSFRTLFGTFQFDSPRLEHCDCKRHKTSSFRPVWSNNSCGFTPVVFEEAPKSFTTLQWACTLCVWADRRKEEHVALALMIALMMKMRHILALI